ncbi:MAG: hypothetical protein U0Q16_17555 [Bryobacteraceae bacterium]
MDKMLESNSPGDLVLAALARDGEKSLRRIVKRICDLPPDERQRALAQVGLLVGLRSFGVQFKMELKRMGMASAIAKNEFLRPYLEEAEARGWKGGKEEGREEGREEGKADIIRLQLDSRFGPLPKWADSRVRKATPSQIRQWARKVVVAPDLESVIGRR